MSSEETMKTDLNFEIKPNEKWLKLKFLFESEFLSPNQDFTTCSFFYCVSKVQSVWNS